MDQNSFNYMDQYGSIMPFLCIGGFIFMAIIIFVVVMKRTGKARKKANNFFPELAQRTGLQLADNGLSGMYKGYQVHFQYKLNVNAMAAYKTLSGRSNVSGKNAMFPTLHVEVMSALPFPQLAIYDPPGVLSHTSQWVQDIFTGKKPGWEKLNIDSGSFKRGVDFFGDAFAAQKAMQSQELKMLLSNWKYTDIRMEGNQCKLLLDNNSAPSTIGITKMYTHTFAIQALDIAIAAAKAVQS